MSDASPCGYGLESFGAEKSAQRDSQLSDSDGLIIVFPCLGCSSSNVGAS